MRWRGCVWQDVKDGWKGEGGEGSVVGGGVV